MANRQKQEKANNNKQENENIQHKGERFSKMQVITIAISAITAAMSVAALVVSIYAVSSTNRYAEAEYSYKLDPQLDLHGTMGIVIDYTNGATKAGIHEFELSITEKNNLERAYIIYANNRVDKLELDDMEDILKGKVDSSLTADPDIEIGNYKYWYFFVYLESLDDQGELFLLYTKTYRTSSEAENIQFASISGIEVFGLGNERHENTEEYAGEKIMAEEYARILEELPKYMGQ